MTTIIFRGNHDSVVDKITFKGNGILNFIDDNKWEKTYTKYKGYFDKRIVSDANPNGQYIVSKKENIVKAIKEEVGELKGIDTTQKGINKRVVERMEKIAPELATIHKKTLKLKARKKRVRK